MRWLELTRDCHSASWRLVAATLFPAKPLVASASLSATRSLHWDRWRRRVVGHAAEIDHTYTFCADVFDDVTCHPSTSFAAFDPTLGTLTSVDFDFVALAKVELLYYNLEQPILVTGLIGGFCRPDRPPSRHTARRILCGAERHRPLVQRPLPRHLSVGRL